MSLAIDQPDAPAQKRIVLAFRLQTVLVICALLAFANGGFLISSQAFKIASVYLVSNIVLIALPARHFKSPLLTGSMLIADVVFVSSCIYLTHDSGGDLYLLYFLAIFMAALSRDLKTTVVAAVVVSTVYLWVTTNSLGLQYVLSSSFLLRVPLFFVTSFFAGFLANQARQREVEQRNARNTASRLEQQLEETRRNEQETLGKYRDLYIHHQNIMASINSGIVVVDGNGTVTILNREAERIVGVDSLEVVGKPASRFSVLKPIADSLAAAQAQGRLSASEEATLLTGEGHTILVGFTTSLLRDQRNVVIGAIAVFRDLTEVSQLRNQVQRSERLAFLGEMAASMAHEIRNPMNSISGFAQLLCEKTSPDDRLHQFAGIIVDETKRIDKIIFQTLHFVKDDSVAFESVDFNEIVNSTITGMQDKLAERSFSVTLDLNPYLPYVMGSAIQLQQVCSNLVTNAMQAVKEKGELRITTDLEDEMVVATFADNGPGVPAEAREKIFNPFFTSKTDGTGLGLAVSQKIITDHGGAINLIGGCRRGAVFEIRLPAHEAAEEPEDYLRPATAARHT
jgi:two-component system nitrogen regulation sensor histidine kinase GlnL